MDNEKEKIGLVLEGGGAKGAYHVGAIRALHEAGYAFDGVAGTSIGALNGAMYAQQEWDTCIELWNKMKVFDIIALEDEEVGKLFSTGLDKSAVSYIRKKIMSLDTLRGESSQRLINFVKSYVDEEKLRNSPIDYGLVTFQVTDLLPQMLMKEEIPIGELADYIIASANYPIFKLHQIDGKKFIDGGVWANTPISLLARVGYKKMVVIRTCDRWQSVYESRYKDYDITYIVPSEKLGFAMNFTREKLVYYDNLGYYDTKRILSGSASKTYCITPPSEKYLDDCLAALPDEMYYDILSAMDLEFTEDKTANIAAYKALLMKEMKVSEGTTFEQAAVRFLENAARVYGVDKFNEYSVAQMAKALFDEAKTDIFNKKGKLYKSDIVKDTELRQIFATLIKYLYRVKV